MVSQGHKDLTHWGRVTHICVSKLTIIGSDNGLSPGLRQAIIWTIAGMLLIGPLGTNFSEILIGIETFSFKKLHLKTSSEKWRLFSLGLYELTQWGWVTCCLLSTKPLSEPMHTSCQLDHPKKHISIKFYFKFKSFRSWKSIWYCYCYKTPFMLFQP